jgi:hydrogenase nickel incorporation protein HypB
MCAICGCSEGAETRITDPAGNTHAQPRDDGHRHSYGHTHDHHHGEGHTHPHEHPHEHHHGEEHAHLHEPGASVATLRETQHGNLLRVEQDVLARNNRIAERNRGWLEGRGVLALNLLSSPGAGKTSLLEKTIRALRSEIEIRVVEGDQETTLDAERIRAAGCPSVQVNTGTGCHLDAPMLAHALRSLDPPRGSLLLIENVGNLVCPALFDLGEALKVVILSVTEGEDKPLKYPHMFRASQLMVLNKTDLLAHVDFDVQACFAHARRVNPEIELLQLSARSGAGLEDWYAWLRARTAAVRLRAVS